MLRSAAVTLEQGLSVSCMWTQVLGRGWRGGQRLDTLLSGSVVLWEEAAVFEWEEGAEVCEGGVHPHRQNSLAHSHLAGPGNWPRATTRGREGKGPLGPPE